MKFTFNPFSSENKASKKDDKEDPIELQLGKDNPKISELKDIQETHKSLLKFEKISEEEVRDTVPELFAETRDEKYKDCQFYKFIKAQISNDIFEYQAIGDVHTTDEQYGVVLSIRTAFGKPIGEVKEMIIKVDTAPNQN